MKTKILASQILRATDLSENAAEEMCRKYVTGEMGVEDDPISAVVLCAFNKNISEPDHDLFISDLKHTIHQLNKAIKFVEQFQDDDELLTADINNLCK